MSIFDFFKSAAALAVLSIPILCPVAAQTDVPQDMPRLPSVNEYRLPPGNSDQPAQNPAEGPVDEGAPPVVIPRNTPAPTPVRPQANPQSRNAPRQALPAPTQRAAAAPQPARAMTPAPNTPTDTPSNPQAEITTSPQIIPKDLSESSTSEETGNSTASPPATGSDDTLAVTAEPENDISKWIYALIGLGVLAAAAAATSLLYVRKRKKVVENDTLFEEKPFEEPLKPVPALAKKNPKIYSPPNPADNHPVPPTPAPIAPSPVNAGGFITTKIGAALPSAISPAPQPPSVTNTEIPQTGDLAIEMVAEAASSTLLNAVVSYSVTLRNTATRPMTGIALSGALLQAEQAKANQPAPDDSLLHDLPELAPGESIVFSGDLRLPLGAIQPIHVNSQALFIPLVWFCACYEYANGEQFSQSASFLVGGEHEPTRPKMAPFRLDLGPRNFGKVGTRPVII